MVNALRLSAAAGLVLALGAASSAHAQVSIDTSLTGLPVDPNFLSVNLTGVPLGSSAPFTIGSGSSAITVSFNGTPSIQGVVQGSLTDEYAAPVTDSSGDKYAGNYFSTGNVGDIEFSFTGNQFALALLWGSVDLSNQITFLENGTVVATVLGSDINANANGSQGFGGSYYTLINTTLPFDEVELSSGVTSFESAEYEVDPQNFGVPEPASVAAFGVGLLGLAAMRRRRA